MHKEQQLQFEKIYGGNAGSLWVSDITKVQVDGVDKWKLGDDTYGTYAEAFKQIEECEERFENDFMTYLSTGIASTEEMRTIFDRMKAVLKRIVETMGFSLSPEMCRAFDTLLFSSHDELQTNDIPQSNELFQRDRRDHQGTISRCSRTDDACFGYIRWSR